MNRAPVAVNHRFQTWGLIFLFGFLIPAIAIQSAFFDDTREVGVLGLIVLFTAPPAWWLALEARFRIEVSEAGIAHRRPWGPFERIAWGEVTLVRYRPVARTLEIRDGAEGSAPIRVSLLRENVGVVAEHVARSVPRSALDDAARKLFRVK